MYSQQDILVQQYDTVDSLELYAEHAHSSLVYLTLETVGITDETSLQAASHVGVSSGITVFLRSLPVKLRVRSCPPLI
jgi:hypothetical protein